jgi:hypothetical protein
MEMNASGVDLDEFETSKHESFDIEQDDDTILLFISTHHI